MAHGRDVMKLILLISLFYCCKSDELVGHLRPLGEQRETEGHVDVLEEIPDVRTFFEKYLNASKPVVFKGAAKHMPAYTKWTDQYLKEHFGSLKADVEEGKKENRSLDMWTWTYKEFLEKYQKEDIYMVNSLEPAMRGDLRLFPCISCGGYSRVLNDVIMWFSSGGTKSVLHTDHIDNINCLFSGTKTLYMVDWRYGDKYLVLDAPSGSFSQADVDAIDLVKYPGFSKAPWWRAEMEAGDCLFIPSGWYHQVRSFAENNRNMAVNVWFYHLHKVNLSECDTNEDAGQFVPLDKFKFNDIESVRFLLALEVEKEPLSYKQVAKRLLMHGSGIDKKQLRNVLKVMDTNKDKTISLDEVNQYSENVLRYLSGLFPGLSKVSGEEEDDEEDENETDFQSHQEKAEELLNENEKEEL